MANNQKWAVIGAGPAGIAAVGKLLDAGVAEQNISWIDPAFAVGDFASQWFSVPSNTNVSLFLAFLQACRSFYFAERPAPFKLESCDPKATCRLYLVVEALRYVTERLRNQVLTYSSTVKSITRKEDIWCVDLDHENLFVDKLILAIGAESKTMHYSGVEAISLVDALDFGRLSERLMTNDAVAVFGSSHSAVLAMRYCYELGVKKIINFYLTPLCFAEHKDNVILHDDTGLKATTAEWAHEYLEKAKAKNIERIYASPENVEKHLKQANKMIAAIGFKRRAILIDGTNEFSYNPHTGEIKRNLYGCGIAFPQLAADPAGDEEFRVGLWKFMQYLDEVLPQWLL